MSLHTSTTLLFGAWLIHNSRWDSNSPSNAATRSDLHYEHFNLNALNAIF